MSSAYAPGSATKRLSKARLKCVTLGGIPARVHVPAVYTSPHLAQQGRGQRHVGRVGAQREGVAARAAVRALAVGRGRREHELCGAAGAARRLQAGGEGGSDGATHCRRAAAAGGGSRDDKDARRQGRGACVHGVPLEGGGEVGRAACQLGARLGVH
eukprot:scaffold67311_cov60-Phaeocystis_antarctica.AAC.6